MKGKRIKKALALALCLGFVMNITVQAREIPEGGIDYSPVFNADFYYHAYPDLQAAVGNDAEALLKHFVTSGMKEGRTASAEFNVRDYMANNVDLISVFGTGNLSDYYYHYIQSGKAEGRISVSKGRPEGVIASYSTAYSTEEERAINVELASARINGIVLQPGDGFSFSDSVLSRTVGNGYVMAPSIASGRIVESIGGGICQVSSTLYVATVLASMPATEHHSHSLKVDYVPLGMDAAIVEGVKDLRFTNPYDFAVRISSETKDGTLTVSICRA